MTDSATDDARVAALQGAVARLDRTLALRLADEALAAGVDHPLVLLLAAEAREARGDDAAALGLYQRASEDYSEEPEAWRRLAALLARLGRLEEAMAAYENALDLAPDVYPTLLAAGGAALAMGDLDAAERLCRRAGTLRPLEAEPAAALAAIAARRGDAAGARRLATQALTRKPTAITAQLALARAELLEGEAAAAAGRCAGLLEQGPLDPGARIGLLELRAEALDAADRCAEAFADYEARNALLAQTHRASAALPSGETRTDQARRLARSLRGTAPERPSGAEGAGDAPAFLLSFPRSGTTLLEKALAGHSAFATLEEVDVLGPLAAPFLEEPGGLERLAALSPQARGDLRKAYEAGVAAHLGPAAAGRRVIDKLPLHTLSLPVIAALFPQAKVLFALRDPRDVVLSSFRRRFRINPAMYELLTLEGAARFYDAVMDLADAARTVLPLRVLEVRHEAVVADFRSEAESMLAFLGAGWEEGVAGFAERARALPRTPSDPQIARGLNAEGVGAWRRYAAPMAPALPILAPWVERFGYPAS